jgi:hypothetical protein
MKIAIGDQVRVHFHPPGPMRSFCEGVVRRVDVTTPEERFFVVEVMYEIILDREHRIPDPVFRITSATNVGTTFQTGSRFSRPQDRTWRGAPRPM